ncbi:aldo/keto reductase [Streptomyces durbertensis]|uniref:aldo/keto reductase n=1 Tax=Streptomyces durbertensis TaxID=2448886 RepID=UPI002B1F7857|nr:aldo/keto reductase [Streptomyces durbertensis]
MSDAPTITLNNGVVMPQLGFGVWQVPDDEATAAVGHALEAGYRSIDTAAVYENEVGTGRALAASGLPREELFVTTKVWNSEQGYDSTLRAFDASLERLGLEYVDLYLIHWPMPMFDTYVETWRALEKLYADGRARAIGVSNFKPAQLRRLAEETATVPALNQVELHPTLQQGELRAYHREHSVVTEAWSPLGQGKDILADPVIGAIAERHGRTPAQVILRWHLQLGNVVIPKSVTPSRIRENINVFDFALDEADMASIAGLDTGTRLGPDPDEMDWRG